MSEQVLSRRRRTFAVLLAFLIPGGGHLLLGRAAKGLNLLMVSMVAVAAMVYYANTAGGAHLLLLALLGLTVPAVYFYSVYDALQQLARTAEGKPVGTVTLLQGMAMSLCGAALLVLLHPPAMLAPWLEIAGVYAPGAALMLLGGWLAWRMALGRVRLGRGTAAVCLLASGLTLLAAPPASGHTVGIIQWWPAAIVMLGMETALISIRSREQDRRVSMDWIGMASVVVILAASYAVTELADIPYRWLDQFKNDYSELAGFTEEKGQRFDGETLYGELPRSGEAAQRIEIVNANGNLTVLSTNEPDVRVESEVWIDLADRAAAQEAAEAAGVNLARDGERLIIKGAGDPYGEKQLKPRINLIVYLPSSLYTVKEETPAIGKEEHTGSDGTDAQQEPDGGQMEPEAEQEPVEADAANGNRNRTADLEPEHAEESERADPSGAGDQERQAQPDPLLAMKVKVQSGTISIDGSLLVGGLEVEALYSRLYVRHVAGPLAATVRSGSIEGKQLHGSSQLVIENGNIVVHGADGELNLTAVNGSIEVQQAADTIEAETKNGQIQIIEAAGVVKADTLNGGIEVASSTVGGPWDLDSSIGEIRLGLPEEGNYAVFGAVTFGEIYTDLPLEVSGKKVSGSLGEGSYNIRVNANSSIYLKKYIMKTSSPFIDKQ